MRTSPSSTTTWKGAVYNDVLVAPTVAGSHTYGVEFDGRWTSDYGVSVTTNDVLEDPTTYDPVDPNYNGKQAERIPKYQFRVTPAYKFDVGPVKTTCTAPSRRLVSAGRILATPRTCRPTRRSMRA